MYLHNDNIPECKHYTYKKGNVNNMNAIKVLLNELDKGKKSGEEKGWLTPEEVEEHLCKRYNIKQDKQ